MAIVLKFVDIKPGLLELFESIFETQCTVQSGPINGTMFYTPITSSNIDRFLPFFHYQNQEKICSNNITIDSTTLQCVATLPSEISVS